MNTIELYYIIDLQYLLTKYMVKILLNFIRLLNFLLNKIHGKKFVNITLKKNLLTQHMVNSVQIWNYMEKYEKNVCSLTIFHDQLTSYEIFTMNF